MIKRLILYDIGLATGHGGLADASQCKMSNKAPLCDGSHKTVDPAAIQARQSACKNTAAHEAPSKLCTSCGFIPPPEDD